MAFKKDPLLVNIDVRFVKQVALEFMARNNIKATDKKVPSDIWRSILHVLGVDLNEGYKTLKNLDGEKTVVIRNPSLPYTGIRTSVIACKIRDDYPFKGIYFKRWGDQIDVLSTKIKPEELAAVLNLDTFGLTAYIREPRIKPRAAESNT